MRKQIKWKSSYNKFAKTEEFADWAIERRNKLKLKALDIANGLCYNKSSQTET